MKPLKCPFLQNNTSCTKKRPCGHTFKGLPSCPYKTPLKCPYFLDWLEFIRISNKYAYNASKALYRAFERESDND